MFYTVSVWGETAAPVGHMTIWPLFHTSVTAAAPPGSSSGRRPRLVKLDLLFVSHQASALQPVQGPAGPPGVREARGSLGAAHHDGRSFLCTTVAGRQGQFRYRLSHRDTHTVCTAAPDPDLSFFHLQTLLLASMTSW